MKQLKHKLNREQFIQQKYMIPNVEKQRAVSRRNKEDVVGLQKVVGKLCVQSYWGNKGHFKRTFGALKKDDPDRAAGMRLIEDMNARCSREEWRHLCRPDNCGDDHSSAAGGCIQNTAWYLGFGFFFSILVGHEGVEKKYGT